MLLKMLCIRRIYSDSYLMKKTTISIFFKSGVYPSALEFCREVPLYTVIIQTRFISSMLIHFLYHVPEKIYLCAYCTYIYKQM